MTTDHDKLELKAHNSENLMAEWYTDDEFIQEFYDILESDQKGRRVYPPTAEE